MSKLLKFTINEEGLLEKEVLEVKGEVIPYEMLKGNVEGWIEMVYYVELGSDNLALVVNEEGLLDGLKPTFWLYGKDNMEIMPSPLVGNVLVVGLKGEDIIGLNDIEIEEVLKRVMVDGTGKRYFLPLNKEYMKERDEFIGKLFGG